MYKNSTMQFLKCSLLLLFLSCSFENELSLKNGIETTLLNWGLKAQVSSIVAQDTLVINIKYIKDNEFPVFLDHESNAVIVYALIYTAHKHIVQYDFLRVRLEFEGYPDILNLILSNKDILAISDRYSDNEEYLSLLKISLTRFKYLGVLEITETIKFLSKDYSLTFPCKRTYWELLYDFSLICNKQSLDKSELETLYCANFVFGMLSDPEYLTQHDFDKKGFNEIIEKCGFESELMKSFSTGLKDSLEMRYGRK